MDVVNVGTLPNDGTGAPLRSAMQLINSEFASIKASLNDRGAWATATAYAVRDRFTHLGDTYVVGVAHTSGVFATDLAAGKFGLSDVLSLIARLADTSNTANGDALVGVKKTFTGSVARTQHLVNNDYITPSDFGAVGDADSGGTTGTDDTAEFALLEAAVTGRVVDMQGKYYMVSTVPHANMYVNGSFVVPIATTDDQPANFGYGRGALLGNTFVPRVWPSSTLTFASGNFNTAVGADTLVVNTTGRRNTAVGSQALRLNVGGYYNTAMGAYALYSNVAGNQNVAIGAQALQYSTGSDNTAVGNGALVSNTNGVDNTAVGSTSLTSTTNRCVAIGKQAAATHTGNDSIAIGYQALSAPTSSGLYNVVIGNAAGGSLNTGNSNTAVGRRALGGSTTGNSNVAIGNDAMVAGVTTGSRNTVVGNSAGTNITSGYQNTIVGSHAGNEILDGFNNSLVGRYAGQLISSGAFNVAVGEQSLSATTTGNYNSALGAGTTGGAAYDNTTLLGYQATVTGSNQVQLGNSSTTTYAYGAVQNRSDARDKADVRDTKLGLKFINSLRPVDFKWDFRSDYKGKKDGSKKRSRYHHGLIAQEVQDVIAKSGVDFGGYQHHTKSGGEDVMSIGYEELIAPLIKAVQELSKEVQELKAKK